jgi:hypothetical protein
LVLKSFEDRYASVARESADQDDTATMGAAGRSLIVKLPPAPRRLKRPGLRRAISPRRSPPDRRTGACAAIARLRFVVGGDESGPPPLQSLRDEHGTGCA